MLLPVLRWGFADLGLKNREKMGSVAEAALLGDGAEGEVAQAQQAAGCADANAGEQLHKCFAAEFFDHVSTAVFAEL
jgi:hypothetical protein